MDIQTQKAELRRAAKEYRKGLSEDERMAKSLEIQKRLLTIEEFLKSQKVLLYVSLPDEVDTFLLLEKLLDDAQKEVYCPVTKGEEMEFYRVKSLSELKEGRFHVYEPTPSPDRKLNPAGDDKICMILPGLMFDRQGNRLGYGKGYYDRYVEKLLKHSSFPRIGLTYDVMLQDEIPAEQTDCKADFLVTETNVLAIRA